MKRCPVCGNEVKNVNHIFCSEECKKSEHGKKISEERKKQTCLERYGTPTPLSNNDVRYKSEQTCLKKYGVKNPQQCEVIKEKTQKTNIKRYGFKCASSSKMVKEKTKKTNIEKYGCEYGVQNENVKNKIRKVFVEKTPLQNKEIKDKREQTCLKRYGVKNPHQNEEIKEKAKKTCIKKYDSENPMQSEYIKDKSKQTCLKEYGTYFPSQNDNIKMKILQTRRTNKFDMFVKLCEKKQIKILFEKDDFINSKKGNILKFKCEQCGREFEYVLGKHESSLSAQYIFCPNPIHKYRSKYEHELFDWLNSMGVKNIEQNKRDWDSERVFEADLFLSDYNLVIEFNGLYWHSNLNKESNYHFNKWKFFKEQNIECIQIFENEWLYNQDIVKSIILNKLGKCKKLYARKCIIKEIPNDEYEIFLNENHIQGYCHAKVRMGLYYENELVEVMSFSKPRFNKKYDWENIRTCTKVGYSVIGGFSKLLNFFRKKYSGSIISYIDSRYFNGSGYIKNNFRYVEHTNPNYFYFRQNSHCLYNRIDFQKHKLKNKLEIYDENLSEKENMSLNDYLWIFDCGNDVLISR